ncbi:MAG: hypothetical protein NVS9B10_12210 [Nevskia sp.]
MPGNGATRAPQMPRLRVMKADPDSPSASSRRRERSATLALDYQAPLAWPQLLAFLGGRGAAGVEAVQDGRYLRTVRHGDACGWLAVSASEGEGPLRVELSASLRPAVEPIRARLRALLDLDAQPGVIALLLSKDARLAASLAIAPGLRVPGAFDGFELTLRAILGQQVTVRAATTLFGRFAAKFGEPIATPHAVLTHLSPDAGRIAEASLQTLIDLGLTQRRAQTIRDVAQACAEGSLHLEAGHEAEAMLLRFRDIAGIGDWTANYVAMRALRMADAFPHGDLALCKALGGVKPREALVLSERWRPWRSYAALHLWHGLQTGGGG